MYRGIRSSKIVENNRKKNEEINFSLFNFSGCCALSNKIISEMCSAQSSF